MSQSVILTTTWQDNGDVVRVAQTLSADGLANVDSVIPATTTNEEIDVQIPGSPTLQAVLITSDQDITLKANSSGSPDFTLTVKAGVPLAWWKNSGLTCPISAAVTKFYGTNAGATEANVKIRTLVDSTP